MPNLPLYKQHGAPQTIPVDAHKGLWFERYFPHYDQDWSVAETLTHNKANNTDSAKLAWIKTVAGQCGNADMLVSSAQRQIQLSQYLGGDAQCFTTDWHFVTGMGNPHPVENGFSWHPTLGVPYLSGAAVKGLLRGWLNSWQEQTSEEALRWFGSAPDDRNKEQSGGFIFFDALPVSPPDLIADVMTPHMGKWYSGGGEIEVIEETGKLEYEKLPADWHNPVPVPFLVVKQASFLFSIGIRSTLDEESYSALKYDLPMVFDALAKALSWMGAGAKTSAGYGCMSFDSAETDRLTSALDDIERARQRGYMQEARKIELENMSSFERSLAMIEDRSAAENIAIEVLLLKELKNEKHQWAEDEVLTIAERIKGKMKSLKKWKEVSSKKNPKKDKDYQRTLEVLEYINGASKR